MRVAVIAAGVGNVRSVVRALDRALDEATITASPKEIFLTDEPEAVRRADVVVVPGQGSFGAFAEALGRGDRGLDAVLVDKVRSGTPYLGICLGLQVLFERSEEAPAARGLGLLQGEVRRIDTGATPATERPLPLPHIGWNLASPNERPNTIVEEDHYYFAHSFAVCPADSRVVLATTEYGAPFTSAVARDNILGVQFHPEKSQQAGLRLLTRFFSSLGSPLK
jgi:imidazole glycerol-phosphate synthase subunit HisH